MPLLAGSRKMPVKIYEWGTVCRTMPSCAIATLRGAQTTWEEYSNCWRWCWKVMNVVQVGSRWSGSQNVCSRELENRATWHVGWPCRETTECHHSLSWLLDFHKIASTAQAAELPPKLVIWGWGWIPSAGYPVLDTWSRFRKRRKPIGVSRENVAGLCKLQSFEHADTVRKIVSLASHVPWSLHTDVFIKLLGTAHYHGVRIFGRASLFTAQEEH